MALNVFCGAFERFLFANADGFVGFVGFDGFVALGIAKNYLQLAVRLDNGPIARLYSALVNLEFSQ
jgi:hypothetical protein